MAVPNAPSLKVAIVTNQRLFRDAIGHLLRYRGCFEVLADSGLQPLEGDIIVVDGMAIQMKGDLLSRIRSEIGDRPIVVILGPTDSAPISSFMDAGIAGLLDWSSSGEYLRETLTRIHHGETVIAVSLSKQPTPLQFRMTVDLTLRERQVIRELASGKSNVAIARALGVTENTVKGHLVNIFEKLGADNRVQVTTFAIHNGLLADDDGVIPPGSEAA